jgi:hypothetical protein
MSTTKPSTRERLLPKTKPTLRQVDVLIATNSVDDTIRLADPYETNQDVTLVSIVVRNNKISVIRKIDSAGNNINGVFAIV